MVIYWMQVLTQLNTGLTLQVKMVTVLILESCAGKDVSYTVNSVVDMPYDEAEGLLNAGVARIINKSNIVAEKKSIVVDSQNKIIKNKIEFYPIAIKLNYGEVVNNRLRC